MINRKQEYAEKELNTYSRKWVEASMRLDAIRALISRAQEERCNLEVRLEDANALVKRAVDLRELEDKAIAEKNRLNLEMEIAALILAENFVGSGRIVVDDGLVKRETAETANRLKERSAAALAAFLGKKPETRG
jgi:predicted  nucleic acid-binding Zn-ribbon protein